MAKRRHPSQASQSVAVSQKKTKRNVNNNLNEEPENESEDDAASVASTSSQMRYSRCGKILAVKLRNFMCHENLVVDFNTNANLLIGKNGSGKSAVLTAIIVGLGCKAASTNRSSSIKQLIRTGEASATIEIHLSNDGFDSYERDTYGDKIILIRHIAASGASTYKLKSARGEVISTKRSDLQKMVFYMNIQSDNPVCVLTQDAARSFLRDSDPKKRHELFMKATQLDVIIEKLLGCTKQLNATRAKLDAQQDHSEQLKKKFDEAVALIARLNSLNPIKEKITQLRNEKKWCGVVKQEAFVQEILNILNDTENKKSDLIQKTQNRPNVTVLNEKCAEINANIDALIQTSNEHLQRYEAQRNTHRNSSERMEEQLRHVKRLEGKKERISRDIQKLKERVQNSDNNEIAQLKAEHQQQIEEFKKQKKEITLIIENNNRDINMHANNEEQLKNQLRALESVQKTTTEEMDRAKQQLQQNAPGNALRTFGEFMPALVKDVQSLFEKKKFSKKPIGPMGSHIEVKNPKYLKYIEDCCRKLVNAFIVDNANDAKVLRNLIMTKYPQASQIPTITSKFRDRMYDVRSKRVAPDSRFNVLMDTVNIDDPNVMNCFIDMCGADSVVFVSKFDDAIHLTNKVENVPPNLSRVLVLEPYTEFFPAPQYRMYSKDAHPARYLRVAAQHSKQYFNSELERLKTTDANIKANREQLMRKLAETVKMMKERRDSLAQHDNEIRILDRKIFENENYEYPVETELAVMTHEIEEQMRILAKTEEELSNASTQHNALSNEVKTLEADIKEIRRIKKITDEEKLDKQKEKEDVVEEIQKCTSTANFVHQQTQKLDDAIQKLNSQLGAANEKLTKSITVAERAGPRPAQVHTEEEIEIMIRKQERKISMIDSTNITMEQAQVIHNECQRNFEENESLIGSLERVLESINVSTKLRFLTVKKLKKGMMTRVSYYFERLMQLRKFNGELKFNTEESTLELKVIPRDKDQTNTASSTNSLSGGERSYVTVSLLISLWKCVDHPFYFLDEYDVFTDHVNRKYLTDILLREAAKHPEFQYTFLTPQDIANIEPSENLSIQRLNEPNR